MYLRWLGFIAVLANYFALSGAAQAQSVAEGKSLYASYCASCHGDQGKGDGVAARSLPVKPADHTNGAVMNQFSNKFLTDIITKGGSAVSKSAFMPAWGSSLSNKQVSDLIAYLRSIANPPYNNKHEKTGGK
jgi:mono/diheme cytochrome c family protein